MSKISQEDIDLRKWCVNHFGGSGFNLFNLYKFVSEAKGEERELRKWVIEHRRSTPFKTPTELLEWIKEKSVEIIKD